MNLLHQHTQRLLTLLLTVTLLSAVAMAQAPGAMIHQKENTQTVTDADNPLRIPLQQFAAPWTVNLQWTPCESRAKVHDMRLPFIITAGEDTFRLEYHKKILADDAIREIISCTCAEGSENSVELKEPKGLIGLSIGHDGNTLSLGIGSGEYTPLCQMRTAEIPAEIALQPLLNGALNIHEIALTGTPRAHVEISPYTDLAQIEQAIAESNDYRCGLLRLSGMQLDDSLLRLGGDYTFALIPETLDTNTSDSFLLLYVDGARVNTDLWHPGAIKARLTPRLPGIWEVIWYDLNGLPMPHGISAWFDPQTSDLIISFSRQNSTLSLRKIT